MKLTSKNQVANLLRSYSGKWVTLTADKTKVLGVSSRMETALKQAARKGESCPHLVKAPDATIAAHIF